MGRKTDQKQQKEKQQLPVEQWPKCVTGCMLCMQRYSEHVLLCSSSSSNVAAATGWLYLFVNFMLIWIHLNHTQQQNLKTCNIYICSLLLCFPFSSSTLRVAIHSVHSIKKFCLIMYCHTVMHISVLLPVSLFIIDIIWVTTVIAQVTLESFDSAKQLEGIHVILWFLIGSCLGMLHHFCFFNSTGILFRQLAP